VVSFKDHGNWLEQITSPLSRRLYFEFVGNPGAGKPLKMYMSFPLIVGPAAHSGPFPLSARPHACMKVDRKRFQTKPKEGAECSKISC